MLDQQCSGYAQLLSVTGRPATKPQFHYERRILGRAQWKTKRRRDIGTGTKVTLSVVIVFEISRLVKTVNTDVNLSFLCCVGIVKLNLLFALIELWKRRVIEEGENQNERVP